MELLKRDPAACLNIDSSSWITKVNNLIADVPVFIPDVLFTALNANSRSSTHLNDESNVKPNSPGLGGYVVDCVAHILSWIDYVPLYSAPVIGRFCTDGFGDVHTPDGLFEKLSAHGDVGFLHDINMDFDSRTTPVYFKGVCSFKASFLSPAHEYVCKESTRGHVKFLYPQQASNHMQEMFRALHVDGMAKENTSSPTSSCNSVVKEFIPKGIVLYLPPSGDEDVYATEFYARRLAKQGYIAVLLTLPYYGKRRPSHYQPTFINRTVADVCRLGLVGSIESAKLLQWCDKHLSVASNGSSIPLAVTGVSLGGGLAVYAAMLAQRDIALVPCMGCPGPHAVMESDYRLLYDWDSLQKHCKLDSYEETYSAVYNQFQKYAIPKLRERLLEARAKKQSSKPASNHVTVAVSVSAMNDKVITPEISKDMNFILDSLTDGKSRHYYMKGGHISSAMLQGRSRFTDAVIEGIEFLQHTKSTKLGL
eukprot:Nk52_evm23s245 gene=Nk52_evmTU23s245